MDDLPFTVFEVVEGEFPLCAEANSESGLWVAFAYVLEEAALFARGSDGVDEEVLDLLSPGDWFELIRSIEKRSTWSVFKTTRVGL
jgi:CRP-like cAMP-binding protein